MPNDRKVIAQKFLATLAGGKIERNLLLLGEETYFHDRVLASLKATLLSEENAPFSTFTFNLIETRLEDALDAAATSSLLAPCKIIVVRDIDRLRENQIKKEDEDALEHYLANPNPQTHFVITAEKLDGRKRVTQLIQKHSLTIDCAPLPRDEVFRWIVEKLKPEGVTIEPYAVQEVIDAVGNNLTLLEQELQKLLTFIGIRRRITLDDVGMLMFRARVNTVFDLVDAINRRDRLGSLVILNNLFENDIEAPQVLFWLVRLYRQLLVLKDQKRRLNAWEAAGRLHVPREFAERLIQQEKKFSRQEIIGGFSKFASLDRSIKSSSVSPHFWCEFFVFELIPEQPHSRVS
ncbi:MAG: DNA polymerase III subunit delta [Acidobacteriia bacterium]|nr:DNA polymerase III subunit delta [Terriglobia bacterium]